MAIDLPTPIPFIAALGAELLKYAAGEAEMALDPRAEHLNSWGVIHGGVLMTLLDVAMAHAAKSPQPGNESDVRGMVTIEMKTSFMRPGNGRVVARASVVHRTRSFAFCEASIFDAEDKLVAHSTGTFKPVSVLNAGGQQKRQPHASD